MPQNEYLLRFDDICPTMNWRVWDEIERHLVRHNVKPILAVVPDNVDPNLMPDPPAPDFWDRVRQWQARGYAIAVHGYRHDYVNSLKGLMRLTPHSEFAGLSYAEQEEKMRKALAIFAEKGVRADAFVAPSHSFDRTTLEVLAALDLKVVCDGLWPWPHRTGDGIFWVPQQMWRFGPKPEGVWTVCCHHNKWNDGMLAAFARDLASYAPRMTDLASTLRRYDGRSLTLGDRLSAWGNLVWNHRILPFAGACWHFLRPRRPSR
jgi:peptidoglycan/xylan/chitin deacetylase (PgdA/CDA1 family)